MQELFVHMLSPAAILLSGLFLFSQMWMLFGLLIGAHPKDDPIGISVFKAFVCFVDLIMT